MSKAVVLQHVPFEGPGRIVSVFRDFGIPVEIRRLYDGDPVPADLNEIRVLVVMGGPMGVADVGNPKFPFLAKEVELIKKLIAADRPMLGICLGAQLLAHAGGAKVYPNVKPAKPDETATPAPEFGWGPVSFPFPGGTEPLVMGMYDGAPMFHWHNDTFDLPKLPAPPNAPPPPAPPPPSGNALLSSTKTCKNQAFRFKTQLFGFQYHVELDEQGIEAILTNAKSDLKVMGPDAEKTIREQTRANYQRYARLGNRLLENFVQYLTLYKEARV